MKIVLLLFVLLFFSSCELFEEEHNVLLSKVDGEEHQAILDGEMNVRKAYIYLLEGQTDSVDYAVQLDIIDSLETTDSVWRKKHLKSLGKILAEVYDGDDKSFVESKLFSFFIHYPNELIAYLDNDGFENIEVWMNILNKGLVAATQPKDITINSVANAAIRNCRRCNEQKQRLIVNFIHKLEYFN